MQKVELNLHLECAPIMTYAMIPEATDRDESATIFFVKEEDGRRMEYGLEFHLSGQYRFSIASLQECDALTEEERVVLFRSGQKVEEAIIECFAKERIRREQILQLTTSRVRHAEAIKEIDDELKNLLKDDIARSEY